LETGKNRPNCWTSNDLCYISQGKLQVRFWV
jgi:hypothetical protein